MRGEGFKKGRNRVISFVMAIAMVLTLVTVAPVTAQAAGVTITMHFKNENGWSQVYTYITQGDMWKAIEGYEYAGNWPGAKVEADTKNADWYSFTITVNDGEKFHCKFNSTDGKETGDCGNFVVSANTEKWITIESDETVVSDSKPVEWNESKSGAPVKSSVQSPIVHDDGTITFNLDAITYQNATDVKLMGITDWDNGLPMEKVGNVFTVTTDKKNPGVYGYKFKYGTNSWICDPANKSTTPDGNSKVVVPGLSVDTVEAIAGKAKQLPETLKLYKADGTETDEIVTYSLKNSSQAENVTLDNGNITVKKGSGIQTVTLIAAAGSETSEVTVNVVESIYTYNVYYYDSTAEHMDITKADIHNWEVGVGDLPAGKFDEVVTLDDGNKWLKGTIKTSVKNIGLIVRSGADWKWQTDNHLYNNENEAASTDIYIVYGDKNTYTHLPEIKEQRERYVMVEYDRPENDYDGWNIFSWNTGFGSETELHTTTINGKHYIIVPVKDSEADFTLGFCMRKTTEDNAWADKDGGDHYIVVPADQNVVKAKFVQGKGIVETLPYNEGYEMKGSQDTISFYYRNDALMTSDTENSLTGKVKVVVNGQEHEMSYDAKNERYTYDVKGCKTGEYTYYYIVDGKHLTDAFNSNTKTVEGNEVSYFTYKKFDDLSIQASVKNAEMNYNDNNVLSVSFAGKDASGVSASDIRSITADVSALGRDTIEVIPELMEATISVTSTTATGTKTIPVTVKDIYGNVYKTSTTVKVTSRDADTFDWDEAVIYMTCTDRFFDGNKSNNKAYNKTDKYDSDGALSYHGGDFAGLEQKLDYLDKLGVNTIWITPIVKNSDTTTEDAQKNTISSTGYHGYWASDFTALNPHLGTEAEFKELISAVHAHGMKLMVDVVLNHAGYDTENYFNTVLVGKDSKQVSMIRDDSNTVTGDDVYASLSGLPDFVTENADVRNQLVEWQTKWMTKYDIDYYRVDTVKHVDATTWAAFKNSLTKANPDFKMIGEYAGAGYANTAGELGTGTMDSLLDFDFNDKAEAFVTGDINSVESFFQSRNASIDNTATMGGFLSSHDEDSLIDKLVTEKKLTEEQALQVFKVAAALQLTAKGQAVVYYGEEIGQHGLNNYPIQSNRYDFDWNQVDTQSADANSMLNHYKKLLSIRNEYKKLFARGDRSSVLVSDENGYDVFARSYNGTKLYVGLNIKDADQTISIPVSEAAGSTMTDLYSGKTYTVSTDGKVEITIPKAVDGGTVILKKETSSNGGSSSSTGTTENVKDDTTTVTNPDGSKTETTVIKDIPTDTKASLSVTTDAKGNKTSEASVETKGTEKKSGVSTSVSADVVKAITEKAGTTDVTIRQEVKKEDGSTAYTVEVNAVDIKAGDSLKLMKKDAKTGKLVLVDKKNYTVSKDGSINLTMKNEGDYVLLNSTDAKAAVKEISKSVKTTKTSTNVKKQKSAKFPWSKKLNMANVDKITYTSSKKSVVTVNKNGKITAKKKGTAKVKAVVTLKDGTKKTVTMKVKVK